MNVTISTEETLSWI